MPTSSDRGSPADKNTTYTTNITISCVLGMASDTKFKSFHATLDQSIYHVFVRDTGYTIHGSRAVELGERFYGPTNKVVKEDETLTVSKKMLGEIVSYLLDLNKRVMVWKRGSGQDQDIFIEAFNDVQTPGRYSDIAKLLGGFFNTKSKEPVVASLYAAPASSKSMLSCGIGVSILRSITGQIMVYEFSDSFDLSDTECLLMQHGVREVIVADEDNDGKKRKRGEGRSRDPDSGSDISNSLYAGTFKRLIKKMGIAYTILPMSSFKAVKSAKSPGKALVVEKLQFRASTRGLDQLDNLPLAVASLHALVDCMHVLDGRSEGDTTLSVEVGDTGHSLLYDVGASRALGIFLEGHPTGRRVTSYTTASKGGTGEDLTAEYEDVEDGVDGGAMEEGFQAASGAACLFDLLSCTKTKMGARMLRRWLQQPLRDISAIQRRQELLALFVANPQARDAVRDNSEQLLRCPDLELVCQKFRRSSRRGQAMEGVTLVDILTAYRSVSRLKAVTAELETLSVEASDQSGALYVLEDARRVSQSMEKFLALVEELVDMQALDAKQKSADSVSWKRRRLTGETWLQVKPNFTPEMERINTELAQSLAGMEREAERVCKETGLDAKSVHLEFSPVHGTHLRVTKKDATKALKKLSKEGVRTISQQKSGTLFLTAPMAALVKEYEKQKNNYSHVQKAVIAQAARVAGTYLIALTETASILAEVDCITSLAHTAARCDWVRPSISSDESESLHIEGLRHPLVEAAIGSSRCVPSDFILVNEGQGESEEGRVMILTGPNMGGKSTYIRAVGITVILAHIGSFVPANRASMPLFDRVMCRVGSSDSLVQGVSTFMAEMQEVSTILEKATPRSLVIIDELGRGTSTHDGYGIAYACLESLATRGVLTLFATHYHELTLMQGSVPGILNRHVSAMSQGDDLVMLYKVMDGPCNESWGMGVAKLCGFPAQIVTEAERLAEIVS